MQRNADDTFGAPGDQSSASSNADSPEGQGMASSSAPPGGLDYTEAAQNKLVHVKEKARELQATLADRLDAGADKLRQRNQSGSLVTAGGDPAVVATDKMAKMNDSVARGMEKSADWLRNGDLAADIETQVRERPGRSLLIALGIGFVLGRLFSKDR